MYTTKQILLSILITAFIFGSLGFYLNQPAEKYKFSVSNKLKNNQETNNNQKNTFQAGWDAAKKRLVETGFVPEINNEIEMKMVTGEIMGIKNNKINLKINPLTPLADADLDDRIVLINKNSLIYKLVEKNQQKQEEEMKEFEEKMREFEEKIMKNKNLNQEFESPMPPEFFNKEKIKISDIEIGQRVSVMAQKDIKEVKEFTAEEIVIQF